jgi:hypothetical protein
MPTYTHTHTLGSRTLSAALNCRALGFPVVLSSPAGPTCSSIGSSSPPSIGTLGLGWGVVCVW